MVQEYHRRYLEEGVGKRDIVIVAHGHLNRVLIARWLQFPIGLGEFLWETFVFCNCSSQHFVQQEPTSTLSLPV